MGTAVSRVRFVPPHGQNHPQHTHTYDEATGFWVKKLGSPKWTVPDKGLRPGLRTTWAQINATIRLRSKRDLPMSLRIIQHRLVLSTSPCTNLQLFRRLNSAFLSGGTPLRSVSTFRSPTTWRTVLTPFHPTIPLQQLYTTRNKSRRFCSSSIKMA